jgi:hypothetical protein
MKTALMLLVLLPVRIHAAPDRLDSWYAGYNHKYFNDELPPVLITHDLKDNDKISVTEYGKNYYHIAFNPKFNLSPVEEQENLLHEMCHVRVDVETEGQLQDAADWDNSHGPKWQACMHELANKGAFEDLW